MRTERLMLGLVGSMLAGQAWAAPSLPVTKPPVLPPVSNTGPLIDPNATMGQWFQRPSGLQEVRGYEFHDNVIGDGGGQLGPGDFDSHRAIYGKVTGVVTNTSGNISSFVIRSRITNDGPPIGPWLPGRNSHGEMTLPPTPNYVGTLYATKLTAEFALADLALQPSSWTAPYQTGALPFIIADNEDQYAWYCYTPIPGATGGDFFVPTWDFGDIPIGSYAERDMHFSVDAAGLVPADPRYLALMASLSQPWGAGDLFFNRTTDLKIGDWIDLLTDIDIGVNYPAASPLTGGNVSVFHSNVPEPVSAVLMLAGLAVVARRRRTIQA